jgi:hypothetical protein
MSGIKDWLTRYFEVLKRLLFIREQTRPRVRKLPRDPDETVGILAQEMFKLMEALCHWGPLEDPILPIEGRPQQFLRVFSDCGSLADEFLPESMREVGRIRLVPAGRDVPMAFVRIGRQPARLPDVIEVDSFDDDTVVGPMPAPPSKTVTMRFEWVGPAPITIHDQPPE